MVDLKAKTILNKKGDEVYLTVNRFLVTLTWTASVDLDLMAFYQTKNGKEGGVFPSHYPGGNLGSLKYFPYLKLNSHPLKTGGNQEQILGVSKLDNFACLYICAVNHRDMIAKKDSCFGDYDGGISILCDKKTTIGIPLNYPEKGQIALIAKIDNTSIISAKLINENQIMNLGAFAISIPGGRFLLN